MKEINLLQDTPFITCQVQQYKQFYLLLQAFVM